MKKWIILGFLIIFITGCNSENEKISFGSGEKLKVELASSMIEMTSEKEEKAMKLPLYYVNEELGYSLRYPDTWGDMETDPEQDVTFYRLQDGDFGDNISISVMENDPLAMKLSADLFAKILERELNNEGTIKNAKILVKEKGPWYFGEGFYFEYTGAIDKTSLHFGQYYLSNNKKLVIVTFVSDEKNWPIVKTEAGLIAHSFRFEL